MRKDMQRVVIETVRYGGMNPGRAKYRDLEEAPTKEPMHDKRRGWNYKSQGDRLQPLRRFLEKSVGKKWDGIWSEICEHNDARSPIGVHVRNHTWDFVDRTDERRIYRYGRSGGRFGFYLDDDRILRKYPAPKYTWGRPAPEYLESQGCLLKQEQGIWYFYESYATEYQELDRLKMALQRTEEPIYITRTRNNYKKIKQLNKKELRAHGVCNG